MLAALIAVNDAIRCRDELARLQAKEKAERDALNKYLDTIQKGGLWEWRG